MAKKTDNNGVVRWQGPEKLRYILLEMEEKHEHVRPFSGSIAYSGFIRAEYRIRLQMGFDDEKDTV